jgi:hypothetical protein
MTVISHPVSYAYIPIPVSDRVSSVAYPLWHSYGPSVGVYVYVASAYVIREFGMFHSVPVPPDFSPLLFFLHVVQTGSGAHPTYLMGTEGSFPGAKAAGA